ncbi:MAG: MoaD family protein [Acidobacteria bacterium]|nr:MoaD family protein [Acidobacteriota bacterium]
MPVKVKIPTPLRTLTQGKSEVEVAGNTLKDVLDGLNRQHAGIADRILDDSGHIKRYINVYLNDEDVRHLKDLETEVKSGDVVSILPAIAGGKR